MADIERVLALNTQLGEGPIWSVKEQVLYFVDLTPGIIYRYDPVTAELKSYHLGFSVGVLALRAKGGLVLGCKHGFMFWDAKTGTTPIANPIANKPGMRFNDGAVDHKGRFYAGTMDEKDSKLQTGDLYRLDPDGSVHTMATGRRVPNGIGWSLDRKIMYFTDSPFRTIYAFDYDAATGDLANLRPFIVVPEGEGTPDGLTVDSEGCIWSARWGGWCVARHDPTGKLERVLKVPVVRPSAPAFGGRNLDELYITTACTTITDAERAEQPWLGSLLRARPGVKGQPEPEFAG
jgi:sugar lactone lactonase YvrE